MLLLLFGVVAFTKNYFRERLGWPAIAGSFFKAADAAFYFLIPC